jgi:hypothetical protein
MGRLVLIHCMNLLRTLVISLVCLNTCQAESNPVEAGSVKWGRGLDAALAASKATGKPVFALFQEIPGCAGCQQFGREVLSHPRLVEAIETEFVPLLIHNNKDGKDAEVLRRFREPAWNYQVVRFLSAAGGDIIPRRDQVWDTGGIARRMIATLEKAKRPVPDYLRLLAAEHAAGLREAVFSMHCFWTGEMELGRIEGVVTTEAGFADGSETVRVRYDPGVLDVTKLNAAAQQRGMSQVRATAAFRSAPATDQKKQMEGTNLRSLGLSPAQATKANAWIRADPSKALEFLSPTQKAAVRRL